MDQRRSERSLEAITSEGRASTNQAPVPRAGALSGVSEPDAKKQLCSSLRSGLIGRLPRPISARSKEP